MPVGFETNDVLWTHFDCIDGGKPPEQRARFGCRAMSRREAKALRAEYEKAIAAPSDDQGEEIAIAALRRYIVDWRNVRCDGAEVPFGEWDVFRPPQYFGMMRQLPYATSLNEGDRKNSGSPSPTITAEPPTAPATATAPATRAAAAPTAPDPSVPST